MTLEVKMLMYIAEGFHNDELEITLAFADINTYGDMLMRATVFRMAWNCSGQNPDLYFMITAIPSIMMAP